MRRVFWLVLLSCLSSLPVPAQVQPMQMLAPGKGWVLLTTRLFWTSDNGQHWTDISPKATGYITDVFFLDDQHGWALYSSADQFSDVNSLYFTLARTSDGGKTWTNSPVNVPDQKTKEFDGKAWLNFIDPQRGWVAIHARSSITATWGPLMSTTDGGATWQELPRTPAAGRPAFTSDTSGWISPIPLNLRGGVFHTQDGGKTWMEGGPMPSKLPATLPTGMVYGDLKFRNPRTGYLTVWLQPAAQDEVDRGTALVLYLTEDGGKTWSVDRILTDSVVAAPAPTSRGNSVGLWGNEQSLAANFAPMSRIRAASVIFNSSRAEPDVVAALRDPKNPERLTLVDVAKGQTKTSASKKIAADDVLKQRSEGIGKLSFVTPMEGWARGSLGSVFLTMDGGTSWKNITPSMAR